MRLDENPFTCQCEKEDKQAEKFEISHFYGSFLNDIVAVMGLSGPFAIFRRATPFLRSMKNGLLRKSGKMHPVVSQPGLCC